MAPDGSPVPGRRASDSLGSRMTVIERDLYHLCTRLDEHLRDAKESHQAMVKLLEKHDQRQDDLEDRQDRVDVRLAYIAGAAGVAMFLIQLFGPVLRHVLGLPS